MMEASAQTDVFSLCCFGELESLQTLLQDNPSNAERLINGKDQFGLTPLHEAAKYGHVGVVQFLIQAGASLDSLDTSGRSALHLAAGGGFDAVVKALLKLPAGLAMVNAQDSAGRSPLHWASMNEHDSIVKTLILNGGNGALKDKQGVPAINWMKGFLDGRNREERNTAAQEAIFTAFAPQPARHTDVDRDAAGSDTLEDEDFKEMDSDDAD